MESGLIVLRPLVVAGRYAAPGLDLLEAAFDGVALLVAVGVEGHGPSAGRALVLPVGLLVALLRDDRGDPPFAQVGPIRFGGVGLICGHGVRAGARATDRTWDPDLLQHGPELRAVGRLTGRQDECQR